MLWAGVIHHITGEHEWVSGGGVCKATCLHEPLTQEQLAEYEQECPFLNPSSAVMDRFRQFVFEPRFMNNIDKYVRFR